jgi:ABC-type multidrug transport system ATPase subunit
VELLADPSCLVLDEPTSGLDSNNSLKIIRILKSLSSDGRVIIATIHQPSTLMFQ